MTSFHGGVRCKEQGKEDMRLTDRHRSQKHLGDPALIESLDPSTVRGSMMSSHTPYP
jgi:hypothetical protein